MVRLKAAKQAANIPAKMAVTDRGESLSAIEPLVLSEDSKHRGRLNDVAIDLASASAGFRRSLPPGIVVALADLVRAMNCYYSNLIEGHRTHPVDIERAMNNDYSTDPEQRNLQLEAIAHVTVQRWVDEGGVKGNVFAVESLRELHRRFCELLPDELLVVSDPDTGKKVEVVAGEFREDDVRVGRHLAVSPGAVPRFMQRYEQAYAGLPLGNHPGRRRGAPSLPLDSPVRGWQRAGGSSHVPCEPARDPRHWWCLVGRAWAGAQGRRLQAALDELRC